MGNNYDINIITRRQQVILLIGEGLTIDQITKKLNVSYETILNDKKAIIKSGIKFLKSIGNKELSFYYQGIISDINHIKTDLWSILKRDYRDQDPEVSKYYPRDKIQAYNTLLKSNTELREVFKECISLFVIEDYNNRLKRLEELQGINQEGKKVNYMNLGLPKLESNL